MPKLPQKVNKKIIKNIIYFILLAIICICIYFIFKTEKAKEEAENDNITSIAENTAETNNTNTQNTNSNENTNNIITSTDEYAVNYVIENSKYYAIINENKIEIISPEDAADIADEEAKKEKYQYQPWKSEFYTRGKNKNDYISAELISDLSDISRFYHWNAEWQVNEYKGKIMWKIRLFDENDPLTSLYIYIDATNGDVIGAGDSSD